MTMSGRKVNVSRSRCQLKTAQKRVLVSINFMAACVFFFNSIVPLVADYFGPIFNVGLADFVVLWWSAYGGLAFDLQTLAKRIIGLCCSASGCERNWSVFAHVSTHWLAGLIG